MTFDKAAWLAEQRRRPMQRKPKPGYVRNPLLAYPRNAPCLCGEITETRWVNAFGEPMTRRERLKWKKCCLPAMPLYIPEAELEDHKAVLRGEM